MTAPTFKNMDRAKRLSAITAGLALTQDLPFFKAATVAPAKIARLQSAVNFYLYTTLTRYYKDRCLEFTPDILVRYADLLEKLPNVTPNGLVLPKSETCLEYNIIHSVVADIFRGLGIDNFVDGIHLPVNIRMVNGRKNAKIDNRPRASVKIHSDIWAGEPAEAIMVFLPLFGDTVSNGVKFFEIDEFPESLIRPLNDYDEGGGPKLVANARVYKCGFNVGEVVFTDPFLLHQTVKNKEGLRLSIDFRFTAREKLPTDRLMHSKRLPDYIPLSEWCDYGSGRLMTSRESLASYNGADVVKDGYAGNYTRVPLS